jgi:hypothetical protein
LLKFPNSSKNIMIDDKILVYMVVQFVPFNLFVINNEHAFDTFRIQFCPCFLWHMNKCNTTKNMQMTYGKFVSTPNFF